MTGLNSLSVSAAQVKDLIMLSYVITRGLMTRLIVWFVYDGQYPEDDLNELLFPLSTNQ